MFLLLAFVFMILSWIFVLKIDVFDTKSNKNIAWFILSIIFVFLDVLFCALHFIL